VTLHLDEKITLWATTKFLHGPVQMKIFAEDLYPEMLLAMVPDGERILSKFHGPVDFSNETVDRLISVRCYPPSEPLIPFECKSKYHRRCRIYQ
jgi:hypothetical protein